MRLHDTTAVEEATKSLQEAQRDIQALKTYLNQVDEEIYKHERYRKGEYFPIEWGEKIMNGGLLKVRRGSRKKQMALCRVDKQTVFLGLQQDFSDLLENGQMTGLGVKGLSRRNDSPSLKK